MGLLGTRNNGIIGKKKFWISWKQEIKGLLGTRNNWIIGKKKFWNSWKQEKSYCWEQ